MVEMFTRYGKAVAVAEGVTSFTQRKMCGRCGGQGRSQAWAYTGFVCYDCGGACFLGTETIKVYTAEKLAKLNAAQEKANATRAAKAAVKEAARQAEIAARAEAFKAENAALIAAAVPYMTHTEEQEPGFIERVMTKALAESFITENQAAAVLKSIAMIEERARVSAASQHVGKVGERLEIPVTVERVASWERPKFGAHWITEVFAIVTMRTAEGNAIVSKSASFWSEKGRQFTIRATVKEHSEFKGEKQTIVARVQVKENANV